MSKPASDRLVSGNTLSRNAFLNLLGQGAPLLVALFAIPQLVEGLGTSRFGVLLLAWMVIGYFSLFDLGLSRALTKLTAEKLGTERAEEVPTLVWTALFLMLLLGLAGAAVAGLLSPWLVRSALKVPDALRTETLHTFYLLAISIPVVVSTAGLRGILEAGQHFGVATAIRIPMGVFTFVGPLIVLPFSRSLFPIVTVLVAGRVVAWGAHLLVCLRVMPELRKNASLQRSVVGPLLRFGGWMTVSNVVGPVISYLDRFLIGALVSVSTVAYYATPYEVVTRLWIIPVALVGVLFPAFSATYSQDRAHTSRLLWKAVKYTFVIMFPLAVLFDYAGREFLLLWLGPDFAEASTFALQVMAIGVLVNSVAQIPSALIQGAGRPDLKAKIHAVELPFFIGGLWWCVSHFGINGAAVAFLIRILIDAILFFGVLLWVVPETRIPGSASMATPPVLTFVVLTFPIVVQDAELRWLAMAIIVPVFVVAVWHRLLDGGERVLIKGWLAASRTRIGVKRS